MNRLYKIDLFYLIPGSLIFVYIVSRAIIVGVTYDEAWTIMTFVPKNIWGLFTYTPCNANHHLLNTILIKLLYSSGIQTVFLARLPNLLSGLLYLIFSYKTAKELFHPFFGFVLFILLIINPFLLDFFGLARGYGITLGFQMMALYYFILFFRKGSVRDGLISLVCASFSVLFNFSALNFWVPLFIIIILLAIVNKEIVNRRIFFIGCLGITIVLFGLIAIPIGKLAGTSGFNYGGNQNFYFDTLLSLTKYSFYSPRVTTGMLYGLPVFCLLLVTGIVYYCSKQKSIAQLQSPQTGLFLLTFLAILAPMIQHWLLGTRFPIDRTALIYYPLLILIIVIMCSELPRKLGKITAFALLISFVINFSMKANFYKTALWYFDAHTPELMEYFTELGEKSDRIVTLDFSWPFQSGIAYYTTVNNYPYIKIVKDFNNREEINDTADYYIYLNSSLEKVGYDASDQKILLLDRDTLLFFKDEGVVVFHITKPRPISD
ncbi:MAG: glycosyltransferase family 39 protein [Bacteroidales bacterium]|nr:glycosyltransferase family 39 protein [Bacteroidales bacterium]